MTAMSDAEIEAVASRVALHQQEKTSAPIMSVGEWQRRIGEAQARKFLEGRERAAIEAEVRDTVRARSHSERESLDAQLRKLRSERSQRTDQIDRNRQKVVMEYGERERAVEAAQAALRAQEDAEIAEEMRGREIRVPALRRPTWSGVKKVLRYAKSPAELAEVDRVRGS